MGSLLANAQLFQFTFVRLKISRQIVSVDEPPTCSMISSGFGTRIPGYSRKHGTYPVVQTRWCPSARVITVPRNGGLFPSRMNRWSW